MDTWTNYLLKLVLFVLFIGHIRSLDTGETVYNGNFIVLESLSNWNYRQENDQLFADQPVQSEKSEYFLVNEENNFNLLFKDNLTDSTSFQNLDKCVDLKASYSFEYYLDLNANLKALQWQLNFANEKEQIQGELKKWSLQTKRLDLSLAEFKQRLVSANYEVFRMSVKTEDRYKLDDVNSEMKFAIKNLKLSFSCKGARVLFRFQHERTDNPSMPILFEKNDQVQSGEQLLDFWSNRVFPAFLKDVVDKYYYTDRPARKLNFIITEFNFEKEEEVCLTFDYFVSKGAYLSVNFMNIIKRNQTLIRLYTSEFDERLVSDEATGQPTKLQWNNATVCVKGEQILGNKKKPVPQFSFESFVDRPELKADIVAVTNFRVSRRIQNDLRNYLPNWKFNGERALHDWHVVPQISNFRFDVTDDHQLKLHLREVPADSKRQYYVISDWFVLNSNHNFLTFKLNSNLTDYQLKMKVQLDPIGDVDEKVWSLSSALEDESMRFDFKNVRKYLQFDSKFKTRVLFEISNNKPIASKKETDRIDNSDTDKVPGKQAIEQMFTISEIQLADKCTDELICNNRGNCQSTGADNATCSCQTGWHGDMCEYANMCERELKTIDSKKTGNEFCQQKNRKCLPNKNLFTCDCKDDEFWNSELLECTVVNDCLFKACGLNEHCKLRNGEPKCECKESFKRKDGGVCLKDLCWSKKCPENQLCLHVENEVEPTCYCPLGFYESDITHKCTDYRHYPRRFGELELGSEISPFVLQKHNCQQDYEIDGEGRITCKCLPGYQQLENGRCRETFELSRCDCNGNELCVKREKDGKEQFECVCKAGFFGDNCAENICENGKAELFCGSNSCEIKNNDKDFVCNCDKNLYTVNTDGLCVYKDVCTEQSISCGEHATCFNQHTQTPKTRKLNTTPWCGCKQGLSGALDGGSCADPCVRSPRQCDDTPFSRCRLVGEMNEIKCICIPGMWRKGLMDPCTPSKSAVQIDVMFISKDTNVNPVHKKERRAPQLLNLDISSFNVTSRNENLRKRIRAMRSVFRLSPSDLYPIRFPQLVGRKAEKEPKEDPPKEDPPKEDPPKEDPPKADPPKKYTGPRHFPIQSMEYQCYGNLDQEGCIHKWNTAYKSTNQLPEGPLAGRFLESMIRKSLLDTFNIVFGKNSIDSVAMIGFEPIGNLDVENFGLQTYYNVRFVLHSNTIDLNHLDHVKDALLKKCSRWSKDPTDEDYYLTCAIESQSILLLQNLDLEEYDVCERGVVQCHEWNECFNKRKHDPENFNFEKDQVIFECRCRKGFVSIGAPAPHFTHFLNHTCEDIDECKSPDLFDCDPVSTWCDNKPGSYDCKCQKGYKTSNRTHCIKLCSDSQCINGDCKKLNDHEDFCECFDDWKGDKCDLPNKKVSNFRIGIIITVVVSVIILILVVIGSIFYGKSYTQKKVDDRTNSLRRELELARVDNQRAARSHADERHVKHHTIAEGIATTTFRSSDNGHSSGNENPAFEKS